MRRSPPHPASSGAEPPLRLARVRNHLSRPLRLGDCHRGPPDRGRQRQQRLVGHGARPHLGLRGRERRRLRLVQPLPRGHRPRRRPRPRGLPVLHRVEPHRTGGGRVLHGRPRPLPPDGRHLPRARGAPGRDLPPLHPPPLAGCRRHLGGPPRRRPVRPALRAGHRPHRGSHRDGLHPQRAQRGRHDGMAPRALPAPGAGPHTQGRGQRRHGLRPPQGGRGDPLRPGGLPDRAHALDDRLPAAAGWRGVARAAAASERGRVPGGDRR